MMWRQPIPHQGVPRGEQEKKTRRRRDQGPKNGGVATTNPPPTRLARGVGDEDPLTVGLGVGQLR